MKNYNRGVENYQMDKYHAAIKDFSKAIVQDPYYREAYMERGKVYCDLKKYNEAVNDFTQLIKLAPTDPNSYKKRGGAYLAMKKYNEAIEDYTQSIRLNPRNPKALHNRGLAFYYQRKYTQAIEDLTSALKWDPKNVHIYNNRGNALNDIKKHKEALDDLTTAIKIDPRSALSYYHRGNVHSVIRQFQKALSDYSEAIKIDSKFIRAYNKRGVVHNKIKKYQEAINDFDTAIKYDGKFPFAFNNRGVVKCLLCSYSQAQYDFHTALKLLPNSPVYSLNLAYCYLELKDLDKAKTFFRDGMEVFGQLQHSILKEKYRLTDRHIAFLKGARDEYNRLRIDMQDAYRWAQSQERSDIQDELKKLGDIYDQLAIRNASQTSKEDSIKQQILKKMAETKEKMMNFHKILKVKQQQKLQAMKRQESMIRRKIHFQKKVNDELQKIRQFYNKRKNKVHTMQKTLIKIRSIQDLTLKRYFNLFYHILINHLTAYKIVSTDFFSRNARKFFQSDDFLQQLCLHQPMMDQQPELKDIALVPFKLMKKYREVKALHLCIFISKKLSDSALNDQTEITHFLADLIEYMIDNQVYSQQIQEAIDGEDDAYLKKLAESITTEKGSPYINIFDTVGKELSYVDSVVVAHLTLVNRFLYEVPIVEFKRVAKDKKLFIAAVLEYMPRPMYNIRLFRAPSMQVISESQTRKLIPLQSEKNINGKVQVVTYPKKEDGIKQQNEENGEPKNIKEQYKQKQELKPKEQRQSHNELRQSNNTSSSRVAARHKTPCCDCIIY